jgi:hypothetical protein
MKIKSLARDTYLLMLNRREQGTLTFVQDQCAGISSTDRKVRCRIGVLFRRADGRFGTGEMNAFAQRIWITLVEMAGSGIPCLKCRCRCCCCVGVLFQTLAHRASSKVDSGINPSPLSSPWGARCRGVDAASNCFTIACSSTFARYGGLDERMTYQLRRCRPS